MSTDTPDVAQDAHADRRLNDLDVQLHEGPGNALAGIETDEFAVLVVATRDTDNGSLHEAIAAVYQQVTLSLDLRSDRGDSQ